jgi:SHS2 domain-containing protein
MYEMFEHTADLGVRITASDLPALYAEAGKAFASVVVADPDSIQPRERVDFEIPGSDPELLLLDWLNELLFTFETRQLLFCQFDVTLDETGLRASARGEPVDPDRHSLEHEVKAVTYHGLHVQQTPDGWQAEVILDI